MDDRAARLLAWFDSVKRAMPWRESRDPYLILVSEFMLQQTRVATVLEPFQRFVRSFPTIEAVAAAPVEDVLAHWSGLGYYSRARRLHEAARTIAAAGRFPASIAGLRALPGVGDYTAAAVASIAFGVPEPVLDGNVIRVMARTLACGEDPGRATTRRRLREAAAIWLDAERPGDSNQALMELGATLCSPRAPRCVACPLWSDCLAGRSGSAERYPPARAKGRQELHRRTAVAVRRDGRWLLVRHQDGTQPLGGIWEFPWSGSDSDPEGGLAARYGGTWTITHRHGTVRHAITFRNLEIEVVEADWEAGDAIAEGVEARFVSTKELPGLPHSSLVRKVLRRLSVAER